MKINSADLSADLIGPLPRPEGRGAHANMCP